MPKTRLQGTLFALVMVFCMTYCMTLYNCALGAGELQYAHFLTALREMWAEFVVIFLWVHFFVQKKALYLAEQALVQKELPPILKTLAQQCFSVMLIIPIATATATLLHNGLTLQFLPIWLMNIVRCFPMALGLQVFAVGPFVRSLFRRVLSERKAAAKKAVAEQI